MKILRLLSLTLLVLGMFLGNTLGAREFSLQDWSGQYAWIYDGIIYVVDPNTQQPQSIPMKAVGQVVSSGQDSDGDGKGEATVASVTMSIGGVIHLRFASVTPGSVTYAVNKTTGMGSASAQVVLIAPPSFPVGAAAIPPGIEASAFSGTATFNYTFVIEGDNSVTVLGTKFLTEDSSGQRTLIPTIGLGTLKPQESEFTQ